MSEMHAHLFVSWMTDTDDKLLRYMSNHSNLALAPSQWFHNYTSDVEEVSDSTIRRRLYTLTDAGLVREVPERGGNYQISEQGIACVNGEFSAEDLEEMNPRDDDENE